jgi:hypothetical protein
LIPIRGIFTGSNLRAVRPEPVEGLSANAIILRQAQDEREKLGSSFSALRFIPCPNQHGF